VLTAHCIGNANAFNACISEPQCSVNGAAFFASWAKH
jgi:hypothetical protein